MSWPSQATAPGAELTDLQLCDIAQEAQEATEEATEATEFDMQPLPGNAQRMLAANVSPLLSPAAGRVPMLIDVRDNVMDLRAVCQAQEQLIASLKQLLVSKEEELRETRCQLDKYKSVLSTRPVESFGIGLGMGGPLSPKLQKTPRKTRLMGISAEPQTSASLQDLINTKFPEYPKDDKSVIILHVIPFLRHVTETFYALFLVSALLLVSPANWRQKLTQTTHGKLHTLTGKKMTRSIFLFFPCFCHSSLCPRANFVVFFFLERHFWVAVLVVIIGFYLNFVILLCKKIEARDVFLWFAFTRMRHGLPERICLQVTQFLDDFFPAVKLCFF